MFEIKFPLIKEFQNGRQICFGNKDTPKQTIDSGFLYTLYGNNGVGKTTFMNILSLLTDINNGINLSNDVICFGEDSSAHINRAKLRLEMYSFIFQDPHLINIYTIKENLNIVNNEFAYQKDLQTLKLQVDSLDLENKSKGFILSKLDKLIKERNDTPFYLSGGEKQLLSFIRSMIKPSNIIFADEPWASMDSHLKSFIESQMYAYLNDDDIFSDIRNRILGLKKKKVVIVISHPNHAITNRRQFGKKDDSSTITIPVYKDGAIKTNPATIKLERYNKI